MAKRKHLEIISNDPKDFVKSFSTHNLVSFQPKTTPQQQFMESYYQSVPVIVQVGSAGTGKTAIALYCALSEVLDKSTVYDKIIIIRSAVQAREIGHLKGDLEEKNKEYEAPYVALCDELMTFKANNYNNLKAKNLLEFHNTSFLRGKTFDNAIVIVDEFENCSYHELSTCITRVGVNSRIIFAGDFKQVDLTRKNDKSGLHQFMHVLNYMPSSSYDIVTYKPEDNIRSGISRDFLIAEEEAESGS